MTADVNEQFDTTRGAQVATIEDYNRRAEAWNAMTPEQRAATVNAGRAERFEDLVALGKMQNLGNGRYKVNDPDSWDDGEVFRVERSRTDLRQLLVLPEHGLDESTGAVAFYSRTEEWHRFGTIIPSGLSSIPAVLRAARINFDVLQRPAGGWLPLDTPELRETWLSGKVEGTLSADGKFVFVPEEGKFQNYRSDTLAGLGIVGKVHTSIQPAESMLFLQNLVDDGSVIIESAGALDGGKRIFLSCLLPEEMVIDAGGIGDRVRLYVAVLDRFDGQGQFQAVVTPWRPRCGNTERLALAQAVTRWGVRHTTNAKTRVEDARRTLRLSNQYAEAFVAEETALAQAAMRTDEFIALVREVFPRDLAAESRKQTTLFDRRDNQLAALWAQYEADLGPTAYTAERAFTDWLDHAAPRRVTGDQLAAARATAAFLGSDDDTKGQVHKRLMARVA
jgi:phage/plasmid-like protein (TIGR03299 family)